jgi:hypothetical protein
MTSLPVFIYNLHTPAHKSMLHFVENILFVRELKVVIVMGVSMNVESSYLYLLLFFLGENSTFSC